MSFRRLFASVAALLVPLGLSITVAPAAQAASCAGTYTIVVGGLNDPNSTIFTGNVSQRVGYSAQLSSRQRT